MCVNIIYYKMFNIIIIIIIIYNAIIIKQLCPHFSSLI